nr:DinB family protein [uncultured Pedobacter sp.]
MENTLFKTIIQTRKNFIELIETSTIEEVNEVPAGFNNNIIWNFGHLISSQQILCYKLANVAPIVADQYILDYQKGTKPEKFIEAEEINILKDLALNTIDKLAEDLNNNVFVSYNTRTTSYGIELRSTIEAVQFFPIHDAYHYGIASSIKKVLNKSK